MDVLAHNLAPLALAAAFVWFVLGPLLRLASIACFIAAAGGVAVGAPGAAAGIAAFGTGCVIVSHLLFRARHGHWRTLRAQQLAARATLRRTRPVMRRPAR